METTSGRFRKKPVEVEAVRVSEAVAAAAKAWDQLPSWLKEAYEQGEVMFLNDPPRVSIITLEGTMTGEEGDWIIRGVQSELYPCKPDIFEATYDPVEE